MADLSFLVYPGLDENHVFPQEVMTALANAEEFTSKYATPSTSVGQDASHSISKISKVTQAQYDALTPDSNTLYIIAG